MDSTAPDDLGVQEDVMPVLEEVEMVVSRRAKKRGGALNSEKAADVPVTVVERAGAVWPAYEIMLGMLKNSRGVHAIAYLTDCRYEPLWQDVIAHSKGGAVARVFEEYGDSYYISADLVSEMCKYWQAAMGLLTKNDVCTALTLMGGVFMNSGMGGVPSGLAVRKIGMGDFYVYKVPSVMLKPLHDCWEPYTRAELLVASVEQNNYGKTNATNILGESYESSRPRAVHASMAFVSPLLDKEGNYKLPAHDPTGWPLLVVAVDWGKGDVGDEIWSSLSVNRRNASDLTKTLAKNKDRKERLISSLLGVGVTPVQMVPTVAQLIKSCIIFDVERGLISYPLIKNNDIIVFKDKCVKSTAQTLVLEK
jgi:hypothetical protein